MMLHYFKWPWCLELLADYVDEIYLHLHYTPEFREEWPLSCPKVKGYRIVEHDRELTRMENRRIGLLGQLREGAIRLLDTVQPDLVFFPDEDEAFGEPHLLVKDLRRLMRSRKRQLAFNRCNFWDSMETMRKDI